MVASFKVVKVIDSVEIAKAFDELTKEHIYSPYVFAAAHRRHAAGDFRQMLEREDFIGRLPTDAEFEVLLAGRKEMARRVSVQK